MSDFDKDPWPHAPPLLEDPSSFGSAWWRRLGTLLFPIFAVVYVGAVAGSIVAYWRTGEVGEFLIRGVGLTLILLLLWVNRIQEERSRK